VIGDGGSASCPP